MAEGERFVDNGDGTVTDTKYKLMWLKVDSYQKKGKWCSWKGAHKFVARMNEKKLVSGGKYTIRQTTKDARCIVKEIKYKVNINNLHRIEDDKEIGLNDIARISVRTTQPFFYDRYRRNRITGSIILIDEGTNETLGAGMII